MIGFLFSFGYRCRAMFKPVSSHWLRYTCQWHTGFLVNSAAKESLRAYCTAAKETLHQRAQVGEALFESWPLPHSVQPWACLSLCRGKGSSMHTKLTVNFIATQHSVILSLSHLSHVAQFSEIRILQGSWWRSCSPCISNLPAIPTNSTTVGPTVDIFSV